MTTAPLRLRQDERWLAGVLPNGRVSATMGLFVLASVAIHALVVGTAVLTGNPPAVAPQQDIAVEIVQEMPKAEPPAAAKAPEPAKVAAAKVMPAEVTPAKVAPAKPPEVAKAEQAEPPKPTQPQPMPPKPAEARQAKLDPKPRVEPPKPPPAAPKADASDARLKTLEGELEQLKAEHAALEAERAAEAQAEAAPRDTGLGLLPDSFQAVALPAATDGVGEAVGYDEIVFSALAKAKGIGKTQGLPGSTGVHFVIDAAGVLVGVEIVRKSGVASLDQEALAIVRKAAPFPPPPQGARRSFDANVSFIAESQR